MMGVSSNLDVHLARLEQGGRDLDDAVTDGMVRAVGLYVDAARTLSPVDTGNFRDSWRGDGAAAVNDAPYASYVPDIETIAQLAAERVEADVTRDLEATVSIALTGEVA